jgi:phosphatidylserine decarboxylase
MPIAPDAWPYLIALVSCGAVCFFLGWPIPAGIFIFLAAFVAFFFRDPERRIPVDPMVAVSPADGKVMYIQDLDNDEFIGGPAKKISIFLSVFNVHINRAPIAGTVKMRNYRAGKMLPAYKTHASEENERNSIGIEGANARVVVHQITGLIARRIVCRVDTGAELAQGERYGLIKFGSCTELIVPASTEVLVKPGDKVTGGESILARFKP